MSERSSQLVDLLDALDDLKHDLGKHILLPVTLLPGNASEDDLRDALETALLRTRRGPKGVVSATTLLAALNDAFATELLRFPEAGTLASALSHAHRWLGAPHLDRPALVADLSAVGEAISRLRAEVQRCQ